MSEELSPLELELAAYSPLELAELSDTVGILLEAANDGTAGYATAQQAVQTILSIAVSRRLVAERDAGRTATVMPFRGPE